MLKPINSLGLIPLYLLLLSIQSFALTSEELTEAAIERTSFDIVYDGTYYGIKYPGGDVPSDVGVCTDVVIRSYRKMGIDLQKLVHVDLKKNFSKYPSKRIWGLNRTDTNIDHRRVPNLQTFFSRFGKTLPISSNADDYTAGDLVIWTLPNNLPHIGIVTDKYNTQTGNPMIVHNIGSGPKLQDMLFSYKITGHYRYLPQ